MNKQLAQLNIGRLRYDETAPEVAEFIQNLDHINQLADNSDGFIWRYESEDGSLSSDEIFGEGILVNMSVWRDRDSFFDFVYKSQHAMFMARRKEWFSPHSEAYQVLWWVDSGHIPNIVEAKNKLDSLKEHGATPDAFTLARFFD